MSQSRKRDDEQLGESSVDVPRDSVVVGRKRATQSGHYARAPQSFEHKPQSFEHKPQSFEHKPQSFEHKPQSFEHKPQSSEHKDDSDVLDDIYEDIIFATLNADVHRAVDRMQRELAEWGEYQLPDTSEVECMDDPLSMPAARFRRDGSVVTVAPKSRDRENSDEEWVDLDFDFDAPTRVGVNGFTEDDDTSPGHTHEIAGREMAYDPLAIDDVVLFHEGETNVSSHSIVDLDDGAEHLHPWFDGQQDADSRDTFTAVRMRHNRGSRTTEMRATASGKLKEFDRESRVQSFRGWMGRWLSPTFEVNFSRPVLALAGVSLFAIVTFIVWLISSP